MKYLRKCLKKFDAYTPGEQPQEKGWVKLNTNENPYPPSPKVGIALKKAAVDSLNLYPDPVFMELRKAFAKLNRVKVKQIFCGNGSDEVLRVLFEAFVDPREKVVYPYPSYPLYKTLAELHDARCVEIPLTEDFDLPEWNNKWQGKLLFLASPNSPTGGLYGLDRIELACRKFNGIVVVDEAYADFAGFTTIPLIKKYPNLIVCRTFSKSYSLAGMRIGIAVASEEIINVLYSIKDSYNMSRLDQVAAVAALEDQAYFKLVVSKVIKTRHRLCDELVNLGFKTYPSDANFVFTSPPDRKGKDLYQYLKSKKILVRFWDKDRLRESVRISVGTDKEIDILLDALRKY